MTALGLISRLEHTLDCFEAELAERRRQLADAAQRRRGYEPRLGEAFALQSELDERRARLAELEADLARTASVLTEQDSKSLKEAPGAT
jgi:predicted RNase H-like nuclease (RuvC/YqgF family)